MGQQLSFNFNDSIIPFPRPSKECGEILQKLVDLYFDKVMAWLKPKYGVFTPQDIEDTKEDINDVFASFSSENGYVICQQFEKYGWEIDSELINIMDEVQHTKFNLHDDLQASWVKSNNITPQLSLNDKVKISKGYNEFVVGEIINIYRPTAKYLVFCESEGHVKSGNGTRGFIVDFEKVCKA